MTPQGVSRFPRTGPLLSHAAPLASQTAPRSRYHRRVLLRADTLTGIAEGRITMAFRRWKRPTVKAGGRLRTAVGELAIDAVERIAIEAISAADARRAGFAAVADIMAMLDGRDGDVYRVRFHLAGPDQRIALRNNDALTDADAHQLVHRLDRYDAASTRGPWTRAALAIIAAQPAVRAPDLAAELGFETKWFKANVRKLKELGLTESLEIGYRLSPRGEAFLRVRPELVRPLRGGEDRKSTRLNSSHQPQSRMPSSA